MITGFGETLVIVNSLCNAVFVLALALALVLALCRGLRHRFDIKYRMQASAYNQLQADQ